MKRRVSVLLFTLALYNGALAQNVSISFSTVLKYNDAAIVQQGVDITVSCTATGFPGSSTIAFEWRLNGNESSIFSNRVDAGGTSTVTIYSPTKKDTGWYTCVARSTSYGGGNTSAAQTATFLAIAYQEVVNSNPAPYEASEGQNVTLVCPIASYPPATITWYRRSTVDSQICQCPVYDVVNVSLSDAGTYVCRASNSYAATIDASVSLVVLVPPVIHEVNTTFVTVGNTLQLNCSADSVRPPYYSWRSGNKSITNTSRIVLSSGSGLLVVRQVSYNDSGVYTCVVNNSAGQDAADFNVVVQGSPYIIVPDRGVVVAPEGTSPSLVCQWLAYPVPSVTWFMAGGLALSMVGPGSRYITPSAGILSIRQVGGADEGTYLCSFSNALGNATGSVELVVIEAPTGLVVSNVGGHALELRWNLTMRKTPVDQYILEYGDYTSSSSKSLTFPGNSTTSTLTGLSGGTTYFLRLKAVKLGVEGPPGNQITATTITTAPVLSLISANPLGDGRSLRVRWHISDTGGLSIQFINVTVKVNSTVVQTFKTHPSSGEDCVISGLMPTTSYTVEVSAGNAVGVSSVTSSFLTPLAPPATPTKPSIVNKTSHSISMKTAIDYIGSAPIQFILINVSELHSGQSQVINTSIDDTSIIQYFNITMMSLEVVLMVEDVRGFVKSDTLYEFSVAARSKIGASAFSEPSEPTSLTSLSYSTWYYIGGGILGGIITVVVLLLASVLLYRCTCSHRRGKRISINSPSNPVVKTTNGYVAGHRAEKTGFVCSLTMLPARTIPPVNSSDDGDQLPFDSSVKLPSSLDLPEEKVRSRCGSQGEKSSHFDPHGDVRSTSPDEVLQVRTFSPSGVTNLTDYHSELGRRMEFPRGPNSPPNLTSDRKVDYPMDHTSPLHLSSDHSGSHDLQLDIYSPKGRFCSSSSYPLDSQRSLYKFPIANCNSPVSDVPSSSLECSSVKHMTDNLSSAPTSLVQGPRPSFRQYKGSMSSDRSDGRTDIFPGSDIDVPCGLSFTIKDSLFELDSIDIPKTSYMTDV